MPPSEQTNPFYRPIIGAIVGDGAILWVSSQALTSLQMQQARTNMGLGTAAIMAAAPAATTASSSQLVRGDDPRLLAVANKANLVSGRLAISELPSQATMLVVPVANQTARLALASSAVVGKIVKQLDTGAFYILKDGSTPSSLSAWEEINTPVTIGGINGLAAFMQTFLAATNASSARNAIQITNFSDVSGTAHGGVAGNLRIGTATKYLEVAASISQNFTVNAPYTSIAGTYYLALTTQPNGSIAGDSIAVGTTANQVVITGTNGFLTTLSRSGIDARASFPNTDVTNATSAATPNAMVKRGSAGEAKFKVGPTESFEITNPDNSSLLRALPDGLRVFGVAGFYFGRDSFGIAEFACSATSRMVLTNGMTFSIGSQAGIDFLAAVQMAPTNVPNFAGLKVALGTTDGIAFAVGSALAYKNLMPPATMTGSSWTLPNRAGFLAHSPNADGSIPGSTIAVGTTANQVAITGSSGFLTTASRSGIDTRTSFPNTDVASATNFLSPNTIVRRGSAGAASFGTNSQEPFEVFSANASIPFFSITDTVGFLVDPSGLFFEKTSTGESNFVFGLNSRIYLEDGCTFDASTQAAADFRSTMGNLRTAPLIVNANVAAAVGQDHIVIASATLTDPIPFEGAVFTVFVRNGTATVGGTSYPTPGTIIKRSYFGGLWANHRYLPS